jgi:tetratricopeptide (TPR) repeat protein
MSTRHPNIKKATASSLRPLVQATTLLVLIALVALPSLAFAQTDVRTSVSPREVEVGQLFDYNVNAQVEGNQRVRLLGRPKLGRAFQLLGTSGTTHPVVQGGKMFNVLSYTFKVRALTPGKHTIEPPVIRVNGKPLDLRPVSVEVHQRGKGPKQQPQRNPREKEEDRVAFIEHELEPTHKPYVGEQVTLAYYLYAQAFRANVEPAPPDEPSLDDFWIEDLSEQFSGRRQTLRINGKVMERANLRAYALFPLRAGTTRIEPLEVDVRVRGFLRQPGQSRLESEAIELDVQPLPPDAPDSFYEGNIGQWRFEVTTDRTRAKMGQPLRIRVTVRGDGQIRRTALPELPAIEGARVAGTDEKLDRKIDRGIVGGTKTVEYTLVPTREGTLTIPSLEFSYFDPKQEKYETIDTQPIEIEIRGGSLALDHQAPPTPEPDDKREEADVLEALVAKLDAPRADVALTSSKEPLSRNPLFWALLALPGLGVLALWLAGPLSKLASKQRSKRKRANPYKTALAKLAEADKKPPADKLDGVRAAVTIYVTDRAGVRAGAVSESTLPEHLEGLGVSSALAERVGELLRGLDEARYSPDQTAKAARADELRDECEACLRELEGERRAKNWSAQSAAAVLLALSVGAAGMLAPADAVAKGDETKLVERAVQAQQQNQWEQAADLWGEVNAAHPHAPDVLYNLGTALAHTGDYGLARLALERAALHDPGDEKIEKNRDLVHQIVRLSQIERASGTVRENTTSEGLFWWRLATSVSPHFFPWLLVGFTWLLLLGSLTRRRSSNLALRDAGLAIASISALAIVIVVGGWVARDYVVNDVHPAVVVADGTQLREGPSEHAGLASIDTVLVPGVLLPVEDKRDGWVELGFADGSTAWTPRDNVAMVDSNEAIRD